MSKARNPKADEAFELYKQGLKLKDIAEKLQVPDGTVRRWKNTYKWEGERSDKQSERSVKKKGAQPGNKNGKGAPVRNRRAEKFGFFSKYLPEETKEIFDAIDKAEPLELLWHQIQIAYAAIIRAQRIMYVQDEEDKTVETTMDGLDVTAYKIDQAWDKHAAFMTSQARAQGELRNMIRQYEELLHTNWELASEEQKARVGILKAKLDTGESEVGDDGFIEALNASAGEDWSDEESE